MHRVTRFASAKLNSEFKKQFSSYPLLCQKRDFSFFLEVEKYFGTTDDKKSFGSPGIDTKKVVSQITSRDNPNVIYFQDVKFSEHDFGQLKDIFIKRIVDNKKVFYLRSGDIEQKDEAHGYLQFVNNSDKPVKIKYAKRGVLPNKKGQDPAEICTESIEIEPGSGFVKFPYDTAFYIDSDDEEKVAICHLSDLQPVLKVEERLEQVKLCHVVGLDPEVIKKLSDALAESVTSSDDMEIFFEEKTKPELKPAPGGPYSVTSMIFESQHGDDDLTSPFHHHPGDRVLLIFTTNNPASVTTAVCGKNDKLNENQYSCQHHEFKQNSVSILSFSDGVHHKFHGDFTCFSFHPRDGDNLIKSLQSGNLEEGFLASATRFSRFDDYGKDPGRVVELASARSCEGGGGQEM